MQSQTIPSKQRQSRTMVSGFQLLIEQEHQSNGKVERWFQKYKKHRHEVKTFKECISWYNNRPHGSLDMDTPEQAFWQRLQPFVIRRFLEWNKKTTKIK